MLQWILAFAPLLTEPQPTNQPSGMASKVQFLVAQRSQFVQVQLIGPIMTDQQISYFRDSGESRGPYLFS